MIVLRRKQGCEVVEDCRRIAILVSFLADRQGTLEQRPRSGEVTLGL
jgi:hypothetical protein